MKHILFLLSIAGFFLFGCNMQEDTADREEPAAKKLSTLVLNAAGGNESANASLSGLFEYSLPQPGNPNKLVIDSMRLPSGQKYYFVLFEHSNPIYNRFAVYDSSLNARLIDKSLNGNLSVSVPDTFSQPLISVQENFISKDTLQLERVSLYRADDSASALVLRIFTGLEIPGVTYRQKIEEISEDRIKTSLSSSKPSVINNKGDVFLYNPGAGAYLSQQDMFNNFVIEEVKKYKWEPRKPEITDEASALNSVGITPGADTITFTGNTNNRMGFYLTLDEGWKELNKIGITEHLKQKFIGTRYLNGTIGASISVIQIAPEDSAEMYINYALSTTAEANYKVRNSEIIESGKNYVRFYEFSCRNKKYLLILEASKYTYEKYKQMYLDVISTFTMDC